MSITQLTRYARPGNKPDRDAFALERTLKKWQQLGPFVTFAASLYSIRLPLLSRAHVVTDLRNRRSVFQFAADSDGHGQLLRVPQAAGLGETPGPHAREQTQGKSHTRQSLKLR